MLGVITVAQMTFLEARRNRVIWSLLFFCLFLVLTSYMFQELTIAAYDRIVRDVGLGAISLFGTLLSTFLGVGVVTREIERRTVYTMLAKPLSRWQYLCGKLAGVWLTIIVCVVLMLISFLLETLMYRGPVEVVIFQAFWLMLVEFLLLISFAILCSTFTSSAIAAFMTLSLYVIGHLSQDLYFFSEKSKSEITKFIGRMLFYILPNLERVNLKGQASLLVPVGATQVFEATLYGMMYVLAFLLLSFVIFVRRDLK